MAEAHSVALVTGAGRGIGAATAHELGRRGFHVVVNYHRDAAAATGVVESIESAGGSARAVRADVCDPADAAALVAAALAESGVLDILVCNANTGNPPMAPLAALPWGDFVGKVTSELAGAYFVTRHALEAMRPRRAGRIVYVSSTAADRLGPGRISQSTAKGALNIFARQVAAEAGRDGVTVNIVAPGVVRTEATAAVVPEAYRAHLRRNSVLGRELEPADVAGVIGLLTEPGFWPVTGAVITVDGGQGVLESPIPST